MKIHLQMHVMGYDEGHGLLLTSQMAPQESGSEVKAMARGYFTGTLRSDYISHDRAQWQLSFQPATTHNPFSLQGDNRINTFFLERAKEEVMMFLPFGTPAAYTMLFCLFLPRLL